MAIICDAVFQTRRFVGTLVLFLACLSASSWESRAQDEEKKQEARAEFFEKKVRPILIARCYECHSGESKRLEGNLRVDHSSFLEKGGDSGASIVPGDPTNSLIVQAVRYEGYEMPPSGRIPNEEVEILTQWVQEGAYWPEEAVPGSQREDKPFSLEQRRKEHWAWQPVSNPDVPKMSVASASAQPIDAFVGQALAEHGLAPAAISDRQTLIRRVHWDLLGLPPTAETLRRWLNEDSVDWYEQYVDSLLADPQFGVRFARHWLDLVRFAQSRGHEFDEDIPGAEQYRDYLVRAWNAGVPYDQFVREHIAGDLIEQPRRHPATRWNESVLGTGFWHLGEWVHSPVDTRKDETDRFDNMVDVFSKTFLGLTVACARCHDHKFDAISTEDYYALYGYLKSSHYRLVRFETDEREQSVQRELQDARERYRREVVRAINSIAQELTDVKQVESIASKFTTDASIAVPLPTDDPRVCVDSRTLPKSLYRSNGALFGSGVSPSGYESLTIWKGVPRWSPIPSIAADPFWMQQRSMATKVNSQNRYNQIDQAGKTFSTPTFALKEKKVSLLVRGSFRAFAAVDSHRLIAGPLHGETVFESKSPDPRQYRWVPSSNLGRYLGKNIHIEITPSDDNGFELLQVVQGDPPPMESVGPLPSSGEDLLKEFVAFASSNGSDAPLARTFASASRSERWMQWLLTDDEALRIAPSVGVLREWIRGWERAEKQIAERAPWESRVALAMQDGSGQNDRLLIRGNADRPGPEVPRRFLEALGGKTEGPLSKESSGRLRLAEQMLAESNPLITRVFVNRMWHHLMGRGLVATTDDFGVQGRPPTHPELLDHLSTAFRERDWSPKEVLRSICLSHTYRQQTAKAGYPTSDPTNQWYSVANVRKLEGEAVRDGMFAVAGQLDMQFEGVTAKVFLNDFLQGRGRPGQSGPLNGNGRRSIYLEVRRNFLNPMLTAFDMPTPFSSMGRRNVSNVPAQALTMLNDPLVHWVAERWADRMIREYSDPTVRAAEMLLVSRGRYPSPLEIDVSLQFIAQEIEQSKLQGSSQNEELALKTAWTAFAHALLNSKEMLFRF